MFKAKFFSYFCLAVLTSAYAAVHTEMYFKDPAYPGKCKIQNQILTPGQSIKHPIMECAQFTCDNAEGLAKIESCDPVQYNDPKDELSCDYGDFEDTSLPYPACCHRGFVCKFALRKK